MRATILPYAVILTKVHRAEISVMTNGCIVTSELRHMSKYICVYATIMQ